MEVLYHFLGHILGVYPHIWVPGMAIDHMKLYETMKPFRIVKISS